MYFFDYLKYPIEIITLILITFFVLILITPITTVAELQYRNWEAVALLSLLQVFNSMMLLLLWWLLRKEQKSTNQRNRQRHQEKNVHQIGYHSISLCHFDRTVIF